MRVVRVRQGFNPNSSSLSVNMAVLLAATGVSSIGTLFIATVIGLFHRKHHAPVAATPPVPPAPAPEQKQA